MEPPAHQLDYSDDEEERRANRARKEQRLNKTEDTPDSGETSKSRKPPERRNQRPSESSSRFGSGPSRGRNPFAARRNPNAFPRCTRPWLANVDLRSQQDRQEFRPAPFSAPPVFTGPPMFPPPFNPNTPPPFLGNPPFHFGESRMHGPIPPAGGFRPVPVFGAWCAGPGAAAPGPQPPHWVNNAPPPPPGT